MSISGRSLARHSRRAVRANLSNARTAVSSSTHVFRCLCGLRESISLQQEIPSTLETAVRHQNPGIGDPKNKRKGQIPMVRGILIPFLILTWRWRDKGSFLLSYPTVSSILEITSSTLIFIGEFFNPVATSDTKYQSRPLRFTELSRISELISKIDRIRSLSVFIRKLLIKYDFNWAIMLVFRYAHRWEAIHNPKLFRLARERSIDLESRGPRRQKACASSSRSRLLFVLPFCKANVRYCCGISGAWCHQSIAPMMGSRYPHDQRRHKFLGSIT